MKLYISGPMTGIEDYNRPAFNEAAATLESVGYEVFNPASTVIEGGRWAQYMREDIKAMMDCDAIAFLPEWENSPGAKLEFLLGSQLGFETGTVQGWMSEARLSSSVDWLEEQREPEERLDASIPRNRQTSFGAIAGRRRGKR